MRGHVICCVAVLLMPAVSGCGDSPKAPPPNAQKAPPPAQIAPRGEQQAAAVPQVKRTGQQAKASEAPKSEPWPQGVPREHVFKAFPTPTGNYVIGDASGGPHPQDRYVAMRPAAGADSTSFLATLPEWAAEQRTPSADVKLPDGFTTIPSAGYSNDGWPRRIRCEKDGAEMAYVPGGAFIQGIDGGDANAGPAHPADVDSFYIDVTEVTVGQYARFLEATGESGNRRSQPPVNVNNPADRPALGILWGDAQSYADWAGKALASESEWELAARGPRSFVHPWGNGRAVWNGSREPGQIDAVRAFATDRSVYDVFDMAGNAREWVADFYHDRAYDQTTGADGAIIRNWTGPKRPSPANYKVVKGGGPNWELWHRGGASMRAPDPDISFRCVLRLSAAPRAVESSANDAPVPAAPPPRRNTSGL